MSISSYENYLQQAELQGLQLQLQKGHAHAGLLLKTELSTVEKIIARTTANVNKGLKFILKSRFFQEF